ncbi:MAG: hypothetical protein EOP49_31725 [Sphingobacteriales bacterium]|nr:MAG: hypothetical protein EOP49_31725 [Sphingobacteriales bacterium]
MKTTMITLGLVVTLFVTEGCARRTVVVHQPPPRVEVIPVAPSPRHVWVKGHYVQRGHRQVWVKGRYVVTRRARW